MASLRDLFINHPPCRWSRCGKGRVIKKLNGGWGVVCGGHLMCWKIKENTWASFILLLKTLKQENQHNPTVLQACLGLFKTCGTMVFESSCVLRRR